MKEHFSSKIAKLFVILAMAVVASVMFVIVGCNPETPEVEEHHHEWTEDASKAVAATCTEQGYKYYVCDCGEVRTEAVQATGHKWEKDSAASTAATCLTNGIDVYKCSACGETKQEQGATATGHTWVLNESTSTAATCVAEGVNNYKCANCNETKQEKVAATGVHTYVDTVVPPSCETGGYTEHVCSVCGNNYRDAYTDNIRHDYAVTEEAEATCTTDAYRIYECTYCGDRYIDTTNLDKAFGHSWDDNSWEVEVAATCTTTGTEVRSCQNGCGEEQTRTVAALGHKYYSVKSGLVTAAEAPEYNACEDIGKVTIGGVEYDDFTGYSLVCLQCEDVRVATADHTKPANFKLTDLCGDPSQIAYTCTVCGYNEYKQPHNEALMVRDETAEHGWAYEEAGADFDCSNSIVCDRCYTELRRQPHTHPLATDLVHQPNCQHGELCTVCGYDFGGKLLHDVTKVLTDTESVNGGAIKNTAATCEENGTLISVCTMCYNLEKEGVAITWTKDTNYTVDTTTRTALGHKWVQSEKLLVPGQNKDFDDCTALYQYQDTCSRCSDIRIEVKGEDDTGATAPSGQPWTDASGYYGADSLQDEHNLVLVLDTELDYTAEGMGKYVQPTCASQGMMIWVCTNDNCNGGTCNYTEWNVATLDHIANRMTELGTATTKDDLLAQQKYHASTMYNCPDDVCPSCSPNTLHNLQFTVDFIVSAAEGYPEGLNVPTIAPFYGWSCQNDAAEKAAFDAMIAELKASTVYTYTFYSDSACTTEITDWTQIAATDGSGNPYKVVENIYVKVAMKNPDPSDPTNTWFNSGFNGAGMNWYIGTEGKAVLDVEFYFNNNVINNEDIAKITVTVTKAGDAAYAQAVSTGTQLENLKNESIPYWTNPDQYWVSIGWFCQDTDATNNDNTWLFTYASDFAPKADLVGGKVTVVIEMENGSTFTSVTEITYVTDRTI